MSNTELNYIKYYFYHSISEFLQYNDVWQINLHQEPHIINFFSSLRLHLSGLYLRYTISLFMFGFLGAEINITFCHVLDLRYRMLHCNVIVISEKIKCSWVYVLIRFVSYCEPKYSFNLVIENMNHFVKFKTRARAIFCETLNLVIQMNVSIRAILSSHQ